ncbi:hypothetical protein GCM10007170_36450 [Arthrobacter liuii]|uniref:Uncharacterized protein n=1 Tax=Arthrobacter liuii TaxID=1476996 RepID=A0ABQ2AZ21_9MICC|nr:hypothetical protein [Arthrobacter liuii]GGI00097.1 hypothetical protein GCM10007170_36450 [Arthrobacter liuii]
MFVEEYTGIHSWLDRPTRYTVVHSRLVAVLFLDTRPVDAVPFHKVQDQGEATPVHY